jgi:hypothetical protein
MMLKSFSKELEQSSLLEVAKDSWEFRDNLRLWMMIMINLLVMLNSKRP